MGRIGLAGRQVKFLSVRLSVSDLQHDEELLNQFLDSKRIRKIVPSLVQANPPFWSIYVEWMEDGAEEQISREEKFLVEDPSLLNEEERTLYEKLREWRREQARRQSVEEYIIFHNSHLATIARVKPRNEPDLLRIHGIRYRKMDQFGRDVLRIVEEHLKSTVKSQV